MKLLHIDSSILGDNSVSRKVSAAIVAELRSEDPSREVAYRDLVVEPLAHFTLAQLPDTEASTSRAILDEFLEADIVVIGAPMYNFTVPSQLKAWLDRILIAGKTFRYGANGVEGLAGGKQVILAVSRGGLYGPGAPAAGFEHLETYLRSVFGFIGITPEVVIAEGVQIGAEQRAAALQSAMAAVASLRAA